MDYVRLSKEVSYALRHAPWEYELELDERGFVPVAQLLAALNEGGGHGDEVVRADLEHIIETSDKKRFEIDGERIRALYGHSVPMRILKDRALPPDVLYHGTARRFLGSIMEEGLKPMGRQYVHLSVDVETALSVGARRDGRPALLRVDARAAAADGYAFYIGNQKVWLADEVPGRYLLLEE